MKTLISTLFVLALAGCNCGHMPPPHTLPHHDAGAVTGGDDGSNDDTGSTADAGDTAGGDDGGGLGGGDQDGGAVADDGGSVDQGGGLADAGAGSTDAGGPTCSGSIPSTGPVPAGCYRIDGDAVGALATYAVGSGDVVITAWQVKADNASQLIGFTFTATTSVHFVVKAGLDTFTGSTSPWANPNGVSGSTVSGISNITFCPCE